jgi:hypothetical protein
VSLNPFELFVGEIIIGLTTYSFEFEFIVVFAVRRFSVQTVIVRTIFMHQGAQDRSAFYAVLLSMYLETMLERKVVFIAPGSFEKGSLSVCVRRVVVGGTCWS